MFWMVIGNAPLKPAIEKEAGVPLKPERVS